ncbi:hypothetical protein VTN00DRAFT_7283 [Thermoascus crustaceus]|uniref:uncharacterized protein n=1 Tax=Thermoascus crustaceus TaxID=5088 RepID=UPI003744503F
MPTIPHGSRRPSEGKANLFFRGSLPSATITNSSKSMRWPKHNLRERPAPGKVLDDETLNTALEQRKIAPKEQSGKVPNGRKSKAMKAAKKETENFACRQAFNEATFEILNDEEVGGDLATTFLSRVQDQIDGVSMCRLHSRRLANGLGMRMNLEDYQLLARIRQLALRSDTWDAWIRDPTPDEEEIDTVVRLSVRWWLLYTFRLLSHQAEVDELRQAAGRASGTIS